MALVDSLVSAALVLTGAVAVLLAGYLAVVTAAAFFGSRRPAAGPPSTRVSVLVPAHDEAHAIAACVRSLRAQSYPAELYDVVVVADNCRDATADRAKAAGARALTRTDPVLRGKGHALRWGMDRLLSGDGAPDAIVVVDADTEADRDFLATMVARFEDGHPVVQGESLLREDGSASTALRAAAFLLVNRVRPAGRTVLRLPCALCGNGMMFSRELLLTHRWEAYTAAEDVEFSVSLRHAGIGPAYARGAVLLSQAAPDGAAAEIQQLRWEGGKTHLARHWVPRLVARGVRERRPWLLEAAFELAFPPLGLLTGITLLGLGMAAVLAWLDVVGAPVVATWLAALALVAFHVLAGLRAADAPASAYRAMSGAPLLIVRKLVRVHRLFGFRADSWVRTARVSGQAVERRPAQTTTGPGRP